jgi:hypothetical protein
MSRTIINNLVIYFDDGTELDFVDVDHVQTKGDGFLHIIGLDHFPMAAIRADTVRWIDYGDRIVVQDAGP